MPTCITPKLEPGTVQENRVTEVMKRHFKGEPGAADKGTDDPKKVNWILNIMLTTTVAFANFLKAPSGGPRTTTCIRKEV